MQTNILEYLENIVSKCPEKTAFSNGEQGLCFRELFEQSRAVGSFLTSRGFSREPVVVFMDKHPSEIAAFFGVVYSGSFYVPIDEEMPLHRIELIFSVLKPRAAICDEKSAENISKMNYGGEIFCYNNICGTPVDENALATVRGKQIDTDPVYTVFTSGSTGLPKGVVACHRSVIDYIENLSETLEFGPETVFGNQAPLYVDACLKEMLPTLKFGATTFMIPKQLFAFPLKLIEFLNLHKINTVCWVASALSLVSGLGALKKAVPSHLRTIAFGSEVFPVKQLNAWREALPEAKFTNLYGPTEATGMSCYFKVEREFAPDEIIPIGRSFKNTEILLLDGDKPVTGTGDVGEICIRGTAVTLGYYANPEKTSEAFTQNPLNTAYPEVIYRTGDLGKLNKNGELVFVSRKDYQIKHMGYRIELGEIEAAANMMQGVQSVCCMFDEVNKKIVMCYTGDVTPPEVSAYLKGKLPRYMQPNSLFPREAMPLTSNGKIDRVSLKNQYCQEVK